MELPFNLVLYKKWKWRLKIENFFLEKVKIESYYMIVKSTYENEVGNELTETKMLQVIVDRHSKVAHYNKFLFE